MLICLLERGCVNSPLRPQRARRRDSRNLVQRTRVERWYIVVWKLGSLSLFLRHFSPIGCKERKEGRRGMLLFAREIKGRRKNEGGAEQTRTTTDAALGSSIPPPPILLYFPPSPSPPPLTFDLYNMLPCLHNVRPDSFKRVGSTGCPKSQSRPVQCHNLI